jgi:hypothetical protein
MSRKKTKISLMFMIGAMFAWTLARRPFLNENLLFGKALGSGPRPKSCRSWQPGSVQRLPLRPGDHAR